MRIWRAAVAAHPGSTTVLGNAAACLQHGEPALAAEFLRGGASLEPDVAHWYADLARLCPAGDPESVRLLEQALALEPTGDGARAVAIELARASFAASDHGRAASYASRLLTCIDDGEAIHVGHIVLGRLALIGGDVRAATAHLAAAGASPCAAGFMPDQELAVELLGHGMREAVIAYAEDCKRFYRGGLGLLGAAFRGAVPLVIVKR